MMQIRLTVLLAFALALFAGCQSTPEKTEAEKDPRTVFFPEKLDQMDQVIQANISSNRLPGGVLWFERNGAAYRKAYGNRAVLPEKEPMTENTIFDAASLTKVVATTPAILLLAQDGKLQIDAPVATYIPEFATNNKGGITVRHLMTHTSGLRPGIPGRPAWEGYDKAIELASAEKPTAAPGTAFRYSDINFILLGEIVRRVSGQPLNDFAEARVFKPLGMDDTGFLPPKSKLDRIAPTEKTGEEILRGVVHDPTARRMGGVAGHAGLFTTAADLALYSRCLLNDGELNGKRVFTTETVGLMKNVQNPDEVSTRRALGWDIDSGYAGPRGKHFPVGSFGHTGWTGTSLWIDPHSKSFIVFLSNRNHPDESGSVLALRRELGTLAAEAVRDFNFVYVPGALERREEPAATEQPLRTARVLNGIDALKAKEYAPIKGMKLGLITNHTGYDRDRNPTIDLLHEADGVNLVALFSPEHGIRGELDQNIINDSTDEKTGLPVYSLYGERRIPSPEQLATVDALVFDIQDIGCRFYTYISTMGNAMEAAAKEGKKFFVLDRVNPIDATVIEGPVLEGTRSFVGWHEIPIRHGMTVGELARMFNEERKFNCDLTVIQIEGWQREMYFDQTTLPWTNPSPNMRNLTEAILYPGVGLLEFTSISVGRGTDTPFEVVGAPYMDDVRLAAELNRANLPGVRFVPVQFTPDASVFKGKLCKGVSILLTEREKFQALDLGITLALTLQKLYPDDLNLDRANRLLIHQPTLDAIKQGKSLAQIKTLWNKDLNDFRARREKFLLYK